MYCYPSLYLHLTTWKVQQVTGIMGAAAATCCGSEQNLDKEARYESNLPQTPESNRKVTFSDSNSFESPRFNPQARGRHRATLVNRHSGMHQLTRARADSKKK